MPPRQIRFPGRAALLASAALIATASAGFAADLTATPAGAQKIVAFFQTYGGKAVGAPPALVVTPEGSDYLVSMDIGALTAPLAAMGVTYQPAVVKFKAYEQDDGAWRVEQGDFPPIKAQTKQKDVTIDSNIAIIGFKNLIVIDPALSWIRSGEGGADKMTIRMQGPGVDEAIDAGPLKASMTGKSAPGGALTAAMQETLGAFTLAMTIDPRVTNPKGDPAKADAQPVKVAANADALAADIKLDISKVRALLDLWAFWVAHPSRPELAANEAAFKAALTAALACQGAIQETVAMRKLTVQAPQGPFVFDDAKIGVGGASAGPASRFEEHFSAGGLTLPAGLVPATYTDVIPTAFDIGFKVSGFDLAAAGAEAIADMHLAGDGPPISKDDNDKVFAKLIGGGPVVIDIPHSHVVAPRLDIAFEGQIRYAGGKPTGTMTVHMRDFDKTVAALKALGPAAEAQMVPVFAMAKGLAKADPDGSMTWVGEIGADRIMKVNGLPLGKSPF